MKKILMVIAAIGFLYSCGGNTQKVQEEKATVEQPAAKTADEHNAKTSLDYKGTYKGEIPAADASGIIVSVSLSDSTYVKTMKYVGKGDKTFEDKGKYSWNAEGNTITLHGLKGEPDKYFVGENTLTMLDMDGNKITGDLADKYILKK